MCVSMQNHNFHPKGDMRQIILEPVTSQTTALIIKEMRVYSGPICVTMAWEQRFRLPQISCSNMEAVSYVLQNKDSP